MDELWIEGNIKKMLRSGDSSLVSLGNILLDVLDNNPGIIHKYVSGMDKTSGTVKIIKLK